MAPDRDARAEPSLVSVDHDFTTEYPGADALSSLAAVNLVRVGGRLDAEVSRRLKAEADISLSALSLLSTIDGLGGRATSAEIATHIPITTAAITSVVDTCERRDWVVRVPDPHDRRKIQIMLTDEARDLVDRLLPGIHQLEIQLMSGLTQSELEILLELLGRVVVSVAEVSREEPVLAAAPRHRPARLDAARS